MELRKNPCKKDCPRRKPGCHGSCEDYHLWREQEEQRMEVVMKQRDINNYVRYTHRKLHEIRHHYMTSRRQKL